MQKRNLILLTVLAMTAATVFAQGTFTPRDADKEQAWRIYTNYRESRKNEDELTGQIALLRRDIANSSHSSVGVFGSDAKDRERLTKLREHLTAEQAKLRKLEADWDQKFYGRYGHLQDSDGVRPNIVIPAGRYQVIDSDPSTWAQNAASGGKGMVTIKGL